MLMTIEVQQFLTYTCQLNEPIPQLFMVRHMKNVLLSAQLVISFTYEMVKANEEQMKNDKNKNKNQMIFLVPINWEKLYDTFKYAYAYTYSFYR